MVLLIFALHLRTLSPPLLSQIKQCLLEVANLYALSRPTSNRKSRNSDSSVDDLIGLCYFLRSSNSSSDELKIAYSPRGKGFSLRDFHYAVNRLPSDSYSPPLHEDSFLFCDLDVSCLLSNELLHSTGGKDIDRKIVLISSCLVANMDSSIRKCLLDAADRCVSVEFVFLEPNSSQLCDISDSINKFKGQICDLENCSFNAYFLDGHVLNGLVKRWVAELKTDDIVHWQAYLGFQKSITGSINEIYCKLCNAINDIMDEFSPSKEQEHNVRQPVIADEHTSLTEESWRSWMGHCPVSSSIYLNVIERTSLASLSEGIVVGKAYIVFPSDSTDESVFLGLCRALCSLNQGLVCWTSCNIETMRETTFHYFYILQPSDNGLMLLRRLAGAEEILPFPDLTETDSSNAVDTDKYIEQCLQEVELRDYNPVQHIGGFHQKINECLYESLQSRLASLDNSIPASDVFCHDVPAVQPSLAKGIPTPQGGVSPVTQTDENDSDIVELTPEWEQLIHGGTPKMNSTPSTHSPEKCISEEWEQLIIAGGITRHSVPLMNSTPSTHSPEKCISEQWEQLIVGGSMTVNSVALEPNTEESKTSPTVTRRPLDTRTSKILERLGNPKQIKTTGTSPTVVRNVSANEILTTTLLKPTFHRLKRKQR